MKPRLRFTTVTAILAVLGLLNPTPADASTVVWHREEGENQWDLTGHRPDWPVPSWGPEAEPPGPAEQLTVGVDNRFEFFGGYTWLTTAWTNEDLVPSTAPTIGVASVEDVTITPLPGYPYRAGLQWTYAWEFDPQPYQETFTFPSEDYFHLANGLESVEASILYGIETHLGVIAETIFDVRNRSDLPANDFHVRLDGTSYGSAWGQVLDNGYSPPVVECTETGCGITWENGNTESGAFSRFDYGVYQQLARQFTSQAMKYTQDGEVIASVPEVVPTWSLRGESTLGVDLTSAAEETVWIQRRVHESDGSWLWDWPEVFSIPDLRETTLWSEATLVDLVPITLQPGETLAYGFSEMSNWFGSVMMFELWEDVGGQQGQHVETFLQFAVVIPEPSTLALLAMGAVGLLAYALRKRRR